MPDTDPPAWEALLRTVVDLLPVGVAVEAADSRILLWNRKAAELTGVPAADAVGRSSMNFIAEADSAAAREGRQSVLSGVAGSGEFPVLTADGTTRLLHLRSAPLAGPDAAAAGVVSVFEDAETRTEQVRSLALLDALANQLPVGFALFDHDLRYLRVNAMLERINGLPAAAMLGRTLAEVLPGMDGAVEETMRAVLATGRPVRDLEVWGPTPGHPEPRCWLTSYQPVVTGAGDVLGLAVTALDITARWRAEQATRDAALALQRSLLPVVPVEPAAGVRTAARYVPAAPGDLVGGDWYDAIALDGHRVALVIGDVMGRGLRAAAVMGQLRTAIRAYLRVGLPPHVALDAVDVLLAEVAGDAIATCAVSVLDVRTGRLDVALAGHPPPLLCDAAGLRRLDGPVGPPLGVSRLGRVSAGHRLAATALLAFYTDGLVESRRQDVDTGIDRLGRALSMQDTGSLDEVADRVLADLRAETDDDDVALLVVRYERPPAGDGPGGRGAEPGHGGPAGTGEVAGWKPSW